MTTVVLASKAAAASLDEVRRWYDEPWENAYIPEEERTELVGMPSANDLKWFGSISYDPDL